MITPNEIEQVLKSVLPLEQQDQAKVLAYLLEEVLNKQEISDTNKIKIRSDTQVQSALQSLSGKNIRLKEAILSFGAGSQMGEVTIGNIAMGNIYNINLPLSPNSANVVSKTSIPLSSRGSLAGSEKLEPLWIEAINAFEENNLRKAELLFAQISKINPNYRNVQHYISDAQKADMFLAFYRGLCDKEDNQWREVKQGIGMLEHWHPGYPDTQGLRDWINLQEAREARYKVALRLYEDAKYDEVIVEIEGLVKEFPEYHEAIQLLQGARDNKLEQEYREYIRSLKTWQKEAREEQIEEDKKREI